MSRLKKTRILLVEMIKKENLRDGSILNHFSAKFSLHKNLVKIVNIYLKSAFSEEWWFKYKKIIVSPNHALN